MLLDWQSIYKTHTNILLYQVKYGFVNDYYEYGIIKYNQLV